MKTLTYFSMILSIAASTALCGAAERAWPEQIAAAIAPLLDRQAVIVAYADYTSLNADAAVGMIGQLLGKQAAEAEAAGRRMASAILALKGAGAKEAFFVMSLTDLPENPGILVVPLPEDAAPEAIGAALATIQAGHSYQVERIGDAMVYADLGRLTRLKEIAPVTRPHLAEALAAVEGVPLKIVLTPPAYFRKVIEQTLPELPDLAGGGPSTILTAGFQWAAVGIGLEPLPGVRVVVQSESAEAATALAKKFGEACEQFSKNEEARADVPGIDEILALLTPTVEADRVILTLSVENGRLPKLIEAVLPK